MIVIVGAVCVAVIADLARRVGERIPDRAASAVFIDGALDLIGGSGGAPYKAVREAGRGVTVGCWFGLTLFRIRRRGHSECREARKLRKIATRELAEHRPLPRYAFSADRND